MLASSISQGSGAGWLGVLCRGPTWLTAQLWMSSHLHFVIALLNSPRCDFIHGPPPPSCFVKYVVSIVFPLTCQCDSAGRVAAAHRVVMDTLCVRLS